ncbi:MAG: phosphoribosylformylglycinamidine synthase subunit PurL [bacterium JZ-2024 1]
MKKVRHARQPAQKGKMDPGFDLERVLRDVSMSWDEYRYLCRLLGREPNKAELGMVGALWSEHCSYKSSRVHLRKFPTQAPWVVQGPGENAGAVDLGNGWLGVLKIESHNHPSAIEPHQGAATGVGGIVRDILSLGARPIALLDSLRFGPLDDPRNRYLLNGVVGGIANYGNCIGVPTVGGEIAISPTYSGNPLVNVMCFGLVQKGKMVRAHAGSPGHRLVLIGARTGRDGIHGATFASAELSEESREQRPAVQVGDPFREKLLIEAILEIVATIPVAGIQDLGAAGLTSSAVEMAERAGLGVMLYLDKVPLREQGMEPYEILLSESQERMMVIPKQGRERDVIRIAHKWGLEATIVGEVISEPRIFALWKGNKVVDLPIRIFGDQAPVYQRPASESSAKSLQKADAWKGLSDAIARESPLSVSMRILSHPTVASKSAVYEQYDHMVQINTVRAPSLDAAILRVKNEPYLVALTVDGNSHYALLDPYEGGKHGVAEAARNLFAVGAEPLAITDCLNFGNPEDPVIMWQFKETVEGIAEAARVLNIPVVSGNVSFYNESPMGAVAPTPVVGMVGIIRRPQPPVAPGIGARGDLILVVGETKPHFGGSILQEILGDASNSLPPPPVDLQKEHKAGWTILRLAHRALLRGCHDLSQGGLLSALVELLAYSPHSYGVNINLPGDYPWWVYLFSESAGRYVITVNPYDVRKVMQAFKKEGIEVTPIGKVTRDGWFAVQGVLKARSEDLLLQWRSGLKR